jgi:hypothetical protein
MTNDDWPAEETDDQLYADRRNFYKIEKWSKDGQRIENCCRTRTNRSRQCKKDSPTPIRPTIKTATAPSQVHLI